MVAWKASWLAEHVKRQCVAALGGQPPNGHCWVGCWPNSGHFESTHLRKQPSHLGKWVGRPLFRLALASTNQNRSEMSVVFGISDMHRSKQKSHKCYGWHQWQASSVPESEFSGYRAACKYGRAVTSCMASSLHAKCPIFNPWHVIRSEVRWRTFT